MPRLVLDTASGPHHLARPDWRFRRTVDRSFELLSEVLKVAVYRSVG